MLLQSVGDRGARGGRQARPVTPCCARPRNSPSARNQPARGAAVPVPLRWLLSRFCAALGARSVIANSEVPENRTIRVTGVVGTGGDDSLGGAPFGNA